LLLSLLLTGCRPAASPATPPVNAPPYPTPTAKSLTLKPCSIQWVAAECGYLHVPEDRGSSDSRILELWTVVVRANGPDRQPDPLFYIVGGPGVAVTSQGIVANAYLLIFSKVNTHRDLVFVDQRGANDAHLPICAPFPSTIRAAPPSSATQWRGNFSLAIAVYTSTKINSAAHISNPFSRRVVWTSRPSGECRYCREFRTGLLLPIRVRDGYFLGRNGWENLVVS